MRLQKFVRIRHVLAAVAVGNALALGALAAPAQAAATVSGATRHEEGRVAIQASWHFWASYWTFDECFAAGARVLDSNPRYRAANCVHAKGTDGKMKYHLYIYY
ncbi:hypothetical protein [Actinomadura miaoliensis]|uniref:Uncharacterized protein n=1 Tax=Actinomadura miaoliensis TaxID=430685 RepID=A0ABP7X5R6_9ACTN